MDEPQVNFEEMKRKSKNYTKYIHELGELEARAPELFGVPTGTKLDELFFTVEYDERRKKFVRKPLGGIPYRAVINVVGAPDTGKSVFAEQFAVEQASRGYKVLFVTSEAPAEFLFTSLKQKTLALGYDFDKVNENIVVLDASQEAELRENTISLVKTMEYAVKSRHVTVTVIDSITGFYEHREMLARQIVRVVFNFLKRHNQTALLISQKRSSQGAETAEAAGGLAVAHIVDGTIVMDKKLIETKWDQALYGAEIGEVIRTIRIDGCRMTGHDKDTWVMEINDLGLVEIKEKLKERIRKRRRE